MIKEKERGQRRIEAASGQVAASLVLKNTRFINVFSEELESGDIAIEDGMIVGVGQYHGTKEIDLEGAIVCPGLIDGHIHLESSMVTPDHFAAMVVPHGTTCVITDPHEIANVAGSAGIDYMLAATEPLPMDVFFMLPSCVPATALDESGSILTASDLASYHSHARVLGLAEVMDADQVIKGNRDLLTKIQQAQQVGGMVDGHAPFLSGKRLNAYVTAGVSSDHECSDPDEAKEKLRRGQWIMIREGTAAKNLEALVPLFESPFYQRTMFVTDDKHPEDLLKEGHIDAIIKKAIVHGADPIRAIKMGSYHAAQYFGLHKRGAIAPGYLADLIVLDSLENVQVKKVFKAGRLVAAEGEMVSLFEPCPAPMEGELQKALHDTFHMPEMTVRDLELMEQGTKQRVIELVAGELLTKEIAVAYREIPLLAKGVQLSEDIIKIAVFERHHNTGHKGIGFLKGYGLKRGAVASSVSHDSHNLIVVGVNDADMIMAGNVVRQSGGGLAIVVDGELAGVLPLPVAGLMTNQKIAVVDQILAEMKHTLFKLGVIGQIDPFMTLAFVSLPVIPDLRINTHGIIDVKHQRVVDALYE